jgi:hypothetical protein
MEYLWEWRKQLKDLPNHHSVPGNHDDGNPTTIFDENYVYGYLLAAEETPDVVRGDSGLYYYIDNPAEKTRYLCLDTGYKDLNSLSDAQKTFIEASLKSTPAGWHIVAVAHVWFAPDYTQSSVKPIPITGLSATASSVATILDSYNSRSGEFANCGATVEFCIGGHVHRDHVGTTSGGIPVIVVETDSKHIRSEFTYAPNTTNESSVNGIIADYGENKVSVVRIGRGNSFTVDLSGGNIQYFAITQALTNVSSSNNAVSVVSGEAFTTTLTVTNGTLKSVTVTMGGADITSTAYNANTGVINIASVSGAVVITATAEIDVPDVPTYTNVLDTVGYEVGRLNSSGQHKTDRTDRMITGFIDVKVGDKLYFKNIEMLGSDYGRTVACYNDSQAFITGKSYIIADTSSNAQFNADGTLKSFTISETGTEWVRFCFVKMDSTSIITINEPIE